MNWKPVLITLAIYVAGIAAIFLSNKFYTPRGANDITGPPFLVSVLVGLIFVVFFLITIFQGIKHGGSYWIAASLQFLLLLFLMYKFML